jgi:heavy metal sensor kinase
MNTRSIYFRLILWYSGLVIITSLGFAAYTYQSMRVRLYGEAEKTLTRRARQIEENVLIHADTQSRAEIAGQINEVYSPASNNRFIRILKADHSVLFLSDPPKDRTFDPRTIPIFNDDGSLQRVRVLPSGMLIVDFAGTADNKNYLVEMGMPTYEIEAVLHGLIITLLLGLPLVALIAAAGGYVLMRRSLKPVEDIRATAEQITFGNLSNRLPVVQTGDPLQHLSVTLNQMLQRLEDAYQQVSRFSADASHELRTPLTIMRGELESIAHRESGLPLALRERIGSVLEETERLSHIAESLLTISRLDTGEAKITYTVCDLAELAKATAEQMVLLAEEKFITVKVQASRPVKVTGDSSRLKQIIVNLLDNAIKYTPKSGSITISVSAEGHKAILLVQDSGIGIPVEALPHVFERFYRADKVRSREQGGAGLGLSIVRSICQAHGGSIEIESAEDKGTTCRITLPLNEYADSYKQEK